MIRFYKGLLVFVFCFLAVFCFIFKPPIIYKALADENLPTFVQILLVCGDGVKDPLWEFCDPGDPLMGYPPDTGTSSCQTMNNPHTGTPYVSGVLSCTSDCSAFSTSTCYTCGDGVKEGPVEECDLLDFGGGTTCMDYGYTSGNLHCAPGCRLDLSECVIIGTTEPREGETSTTGGGGGSSGSSSGFLPGQKIEPDKTVVILKGKSYPNSDVRVLIDGKVVGIVKADAAGDFRFQEDDVTPGIATFGLWTEDDRGLKSTLVTITFRIASKSVTTISNIYLSPTIDTDKKKVNKGEDIKIFGKSSPKVGLQINVNSLVENVVTTTSNTIGDWSLVFNTKNLEEDFHSAKAMIKLKSPEGVIESNFSRSVSFYVGVGGPDTGECGIADLNCDGAVNLVDFSILLYNWNTTSAKADINKDGKVGLPDFSIMMFYWTG
jgi:hypothetical protein